MNNKQKAIKYFESTGELPLDRKPREYVLHHTDPSWKINDLERYNQWNPEDLIVMTRAEHVKLHINNGDVGFKGKHHTDEAKQKNRVAHLGKHRSEETKRKIGDARLGKHCSEETKQKIKETLTGHEVSEETRQKIRAAESGKCVSEETKKKISEACKGKLHGPMSEEHKQKLRESHLKLVKCVETGIVYESIKQTHVNNVSRAIKQGETAGGYHWQFIKEK